MRRLVGRPPADEPPVGVLELAAEDAERRVVLEARGDALEEFRRVGAVVVRERDEVGLEHAERGVPRPRRPGRRAQPLDGEGGVRGRGSPTPVVGVLVDERTRAVTRLRLERVERPRRARPFDRRSRRRDRRSRARLRAPAQATLRVGDEPSARVRRPRGPRRPRDDRRCGGERARAVAPRPRARRRRRRLGRRHAATARRGRRPTPPRRAERRGARPRRGAQRRPRAATGATSRASTPTTSRVPSGSSGSRRGWLGPAAAVVGTGAVDFGDDGRVGRVHRMPAGPRAVRWAALFSRRSSTRR